MEFHHATKLLFSIQDSMQIADFDFSQDLPQLKTFAIEKANRCKNLFLMGKPLEDALAIFDNYQLGDLPYSDDEIKNRLQDSKFWLRRVRTKAAFLISQVERALGYVSKRRAVYCGDISIGRHQDNQLLSKAYMENTFLTNDEGFQIPLSEIAAHNVSNPVIRRHELMVRIRGFEEVAQYCGHEAVFVTVTTPSRMHATMATGTPNDHFDGSSTKDAQNYLNHVWQLIRSKLDRSGLRPYGFRVVEPHHDGTPHWHLLLFMPKEHLPELKSIVEHYALHDSPNEKGAKKYRVKFIDIDPAKGSAAGYIAKYIAKNIDGFAVGTDTSGKPSDQAANRINAWSKTCAIRQFQQIGGPSVTVWRELRRLKSCNTPFDDLDNSYKAADSSNWAAFCIAMNAVNTPKKEHTLAVHYQIRENEIIDFQTGEVTTSPLNRYLELKKPTIAGLVYRQIPLLTRTTKWKLTSKPPTRVSASPPLGGVALASEVATLDLCK